MNFWMNLLGELLDELYIIDPRNVLDALNGLQFLLILLLRVVVVMVSGLIIGE